MLLVLLQPHSLRLGPTPELGELSPIYATALIRILPSEPTVWVVSVVVGVSDVVVVVAAKLAVAEAETAMPFLFGHRVAIRPASCRHRVGLRWVLLTKAIVAYRHLVSIHFSPFCQDSRMPTHCKCRARARSPRSRVVHQRPTGLPCSFYFNFTAGPTPEFGELYAHSTLHAIRHLGSVRNRTS